jgi:hypothetical protein
MNLDTRVFYYINDLSLHAGLHAVVYGYVDYGVARFAFLLMASWWQAGRTNGLAAMAAATSVPLGVLAAVAINQLIAVAIDAPPSCNELSKIVVLQCNTDGGLPGDAFAAVSLIVYALMRRLLLQLLCWAARTPRDQAAGRKTMVGRCTKFRGAAWRGPNAENAPTRSAAASAAAHSLVTVSERHRRTAWPTVAWRKGMFPHRKVGR